MIRRAGCSYTGHDTDIDQHARTCFVCAGPVRLRLLGELPELPGSLESAIRAFQSDTVLREALDERFSDYYVTSRAWEVKAFQGAVTDWERDRYMRTV